MKRDQSHLPTINRIYMYIKSITEVLDTTCYIRKRFICYNGNGMREGNGGEGGARGERGGGTERRGTASTDGGGSTRQGLPVSNDLWHRFSRRYPQQTHAFFKIAVERNA